ncbi:hypothetical protein [Dyadobacter chenhuakuii]|uniref:DUF885 domain-containing protein n=1 Tax=Dyadobacter chenhuakuii TaxID=2909339 RepID=A0ABY4XEI1_9BACT|nr:hypothetical protein [Dyadobacter chenhuakuii]MCF2492073.1 hypothetical protein [Dyadobacter chenhuakuii]USJ28767.1 hypothetical protein NFI80_12875 [Dyadobacter chenhuakuii]
MCIILACSSEKQSVNDEEKLQQIGREYVTLGLTIGQYDADFVDAYYGPDSLRPAAAKDTADFPKDSLTLRITELKSRVTDLLTNTKNDTIRQRAEWLGSQLMAFERRVKIVAGERDAFDTESRDLFDAVAPIYNEKHFQDLIAQMDSILPGKGALPDRFQKLAARFLIPKDKIHTVFQVAIAEARRRTLQHYTLPAGENFKLEYVTDKPWSGYNWYKGNYQSVIQINISQPIFIQRAIDLACHEGYPGHHVFNVLLEKNVYYDQGSQEISLYPLFSPQSLIAEGSANYGISIAFPGDSQEQYCKQILMPLANIDTTGAHLYFEAFKISSALNYARNEVARGLINKSMNDKDALRWLTDYCLLTEKGATDYLRFIKKYGSYVINYNYGQDLVKNYIEKTSGQDQEKRWKAFEKLLSNPMRASDLLAADKK